MICKQEANSKSCRKKNLGFQVDACFYSFPKWTIDLSACSQEYAYMYVDK
jgi:hypothetical protein